MGSPSIHPARRCAAPFFVWFHHRSGSSHLCSLLDSHPQIACWGEFFYRGETDTAGDLFTRSGRESEADFLDDLYQYRWDRGGAALCVENPQPPFVQAVGFKLKYQQAQTYPAVLQYLQSQPQMKVIHLVRTNLLASLLSAAMLPRMLEQFQRANLLKLDSTNSLQRSVRLDPQTVLGELEELELRIRRGRELLAGFNSLEVTYEDLLDSPNATCQRVLEFLQIEQSSELNSRYQKIMPRLIRDSLENVDEIASTLRCSRFNVHLDAGDVA